jgi:hypothetical protein
MNRGIPAAILLIASTLLLPRGARAAADPDPLKPRLRPADAQMRELLARGLETSASLRALVERLYASDVVVYLRCARLPPHLDGQLTFVSSGGGLRYLVVRIAWDRGATRRIAVLGHELQHAVEIAERPAIVDQATLAREYGRFGFEREGIGPVATAFDTAAAINAGDRVWREVNGAAAAD